MAWIEDNGVHINLERVRSFWWERENTFKAYLYLDYGNGEVIKIEDPWQKKYWGACFAIEKKACNK